VGCILGLKRHKEKRSHFLFYLILLLGMVEAYKIDRRTFLLLWELLKFFPSTSTFFPSKLVLPPFLSPCLTVACTQLFIVNSLL
jgi:hypothetical protein